MASKPKTQSELAKEACKEAATNHPCLKPTDMAEIIAITRSVVEKRGGTPAGGSQALGTYIANNKGAFVDEVWRNFGKDRQDKIQAYISASESLGRWSFLVGEYLISQAAIKNGGTAVKAARKKQQAEAKEADPTAFKAKGADRMAKSHALQVAAKDTIVSLSRYFALSP